MPAGIQTAERKRLTDARTKFDRALENEELCDPVSGMYAEEILDYITANSTDFSDAGPADVMGAHRIMRRKLDEKLRSRTLQEQTA